MASSKEAQELKKRKRELEIQSITRYRDQVLQKMYNKTMRLLEKTINKASAIQDSVRHGFDKEKDKYIMDVTKMAWQTLVDSEHIKIKKKEVQQGDISLFNELQKEALAGNLTEQQLKDLEKYARPNDN